MFINKWLVTDSLKKGMPLDARAGLCLYLDRAPADANPLLRYIQEELLQTSFSILLNGNDFNKSEDYGSYIETMITIFFQPCYYMSDYRPIIFLKDGTASSVEFLAQLNEKAKKQGLRDILALEPGAAGQQDRTFVYWITDKSGAIDYNLVVKNWLEQSLTGSDSPEVHLLISTGEKEARGILDDDSEKEALLKNTEEYTIASILYQKQRLIEEYKHQLLLKTTSEKDTQLYLSIQKEERANGLKWYYYEYEILPTWYKKFGHIIKVIMGKRSFKSLFSDNVKKYKD